jgi:peptidoglycan/xylan/chitin deacetylase (PgdA/CDA1 family)
MPDGRGPRPPSNGPHLARRRLLLVAAGGLAVGIATVAGRGGGGHLADSTLDEAPRSTARAGSPATTATPTPSHTGKPRPAASHTAAEHPARTVQDVAPGQPMYYVDDGPKVIALTIDDGPSPVYTPQVLQILAKYGVTASFSMIGENVTYYPQIARDVAAAGHTIVNHTWNHANLTSMGTTQVRGEIDQATDAIHTATGKHPALFRAPYGAWSKAVLDYCASEKLTPLDWSVDPADWSRPGVSKIVSTIMRTTRTGSIILEHDGGGNRAQTVAALRIVIPGLLEEGYRFTIP